MQRKFGTGVRGRLRALFIDTSVRPAPGGRGDVDDDPDDGFVKGSVTFPGRHIFGRQITATERRDLRTGGDTEQETHCGYSGLQSLTRRDP